MKVPKKYERRDAALHGRPEGSTSTRPGKDGALRQALVSTPAREAGCMLNAMGTGGGEKNVTSLLATLRDEEGLILVTPYAELGDLEHVLMLLDFGVSEPEHRSMIKLTMARDLLLGGVRLQAKNVQHRDLTPSNHLVDDQGICRISDFGMAQQLGAEPDESLPDIEEHMSPPEYQPGDASTLTRAADSYQIGAMLVQLVYGLNPLDPAGLSMEQKRSLNMDMYLPPISPHDWPGVDTAALRQVMVGLMQADPARRLSLDEAAASAVFADPRVGSAETRAKLVESIRSQRHRPGDESPAEAA